MTISLFWLDSFRKAEGLIEQKAVKVLLNCEDEEKPQSAMISWILASVYESICSAYLILTLCMYVTNDIPITFVN